MFKFRAIIFVLFLNLVFIQVGKCQTAADENLLERLKKELNLDSLQIHKMDSLFVSFAIQLDSINSEIKSIQTNSDLPEEEIVKASSILFTERKDLLAWKTNKMLSFLTPDQKKKYNTEISSKVKPALHFGHNKANCVTCKKPNILGPQIK